MVSILKGAVVFMADLMRAVTIPCAIDFMVVSSYGGANTSSTGLVKIIKDLDQDLTGKDVLIVEDIWTPASRCPTLCPCCSCATPAACGCARSFPSPAAARRRSSPITAASRCG